MRGRARWLAWGIFALTIVLTAVIGAILEYDVAILGHSLDSSNNGLRFEVPLFGVGSWRLAPRWRPVCRGTRWAGSS